MATKALDVRRATVIGRVMPGVPVWWLGTERRFPGLTHVVFAGNVGETDALAVVARTHALGARIANPFQLVHTDE